MNCQKTLFQRNLKFFVFLSIFLELSSWQGGYCVIEQSAVCTKHERYLKSHYVPYVETYKAKKWGVFSKVATRYNYRWEFYPDVRVVDACCHGYTPEGVSQRCVPVCPSGCRNGECYQPNLCKCWPGFVAILSMRDQWIECIPHCPDGCNGGECTAPSICTCNSGYQSTEDRKSCVPSCLSAGAGGFQGCGENASCIAPDTCECHDGYQKNPKGQQPLCLPTCTPTCGMNAYCGSPDKCLCNVGYQLTEDRKSCVPSCLSAGAGGFQGCGENASCIAPDTCECHDGYQKNPKGQQPLCLPTCTPTCGMNAYCGSPDKCLCNVGYQLTEDRKSCVPSCLSAGAGGFQGCGENASCIAPDTCECHDGYQKNPKGQQPLCLPTCTPTCGMNAYCGSPDKCLCNVGYQLTEDRKSCVPSCLSAGAGGFQGCGENASCIAPDTCECHDGYQKNPKGQQPLCLPTCTPTCGMNAYCGSPDKCLCNVGYQLTEDRKSCVPSCLSAGAGGFQGCGENASCIAPDTCECHDGYQKNPKGQQPLCLPTCTPTCGMNAFCGSPDKCLCNPGYVFDTNPLLAVSGPPSNYKFTTVATEPKAPSTHCKALCEPECVKNSTCIAPNVCQCDAGYSSESSSNETGHLLRCDPICDKTCVNSLCAYPNKCICHLGYKPHPVEDFICEPICQDDCVHALCVQPDRCECYDGYVKKEDDDGNHETNSTNVCVPSCPGGCENGKCVAPGQCACDDGYILSIQETTLDFSTTIDSSSTTGDLAGYFSTYSTDYYSTDNIITEYYGTDSTNYYGTEATSDSSSTIAPMSQQICQPLCEPECPRGSICIAPPNQCQRQSGNNEDSNDSVADRTLIKNDTTICYRNGTENGTMCNAVESAIIGHTAASAIGTLVLLAAILGLGAVIYLTLRKKRRVATDALARNSMGTMEKLTVSDPLISTEESSYL